MKIIQELPTSLDYQKPSVITIGNFDGMHVGHKAVLKKIVETSQKLKQPSVVISFANHPSEILRPHTSTCRICTAEHKTRLMEKMGVDLLVLLNFSKNFSEQSADQFLVDLQDRIPFSHLILGWDATLGKDKHGNKEIVQEIAKKNHFHVEYLNQQLINEIPISSSQIRKFLQEGKLKQASQLLGRPYSIYAPVYQGEGKGKKLGFPTANLNVKGLCLPPLGVYAVTSLIDNLPFKGVANLGIAPTMREDKIPVLEVHLFDFEKNLYSQSIEVIFSSYLRSEKKFSGIEELKAQIQRDIVQAKACLDI